MTTKRKSSHSAVVTAVVVVVFVVKLAVAAAAVAAAAVQPMSVVAMVELVWRIVIVKCQIENVGVSYFAAAIAIAVAVQSGAQPAVEARHGQPADFATIAE